MTLRDIISPVGVVQLTYHTIAIGMRYTLVVAVKPLIAIETAIATVFSYTL